MSSDFKLNGNLKLSPQKLNVLVLEDDLNWQFTLNKVIKSIDPLAQAQFVLNEQAAEKHLADPTLFKLIIGDNDLVDQKSALDLWQFCRQNYLTVPFLLITEQNETELQQLQASSNYLPKLLNKQMPLVNLKKVISEYLLPTIV